jgi:hypothetical protein
LFTQVTVVPRVIFNGLGEYAVVVNVRAPATMETVAVEGVCEGPVGVLLLVLLPPHPATHSTDRSTILTRQNMYPPG